MTLDEEKTLTEKINDLLRKSLNEYPKRMLSKLRNQRFSVYERIFCASFTFENSLFILL